MLSMSIIIMETPKEYVLRQMAEGKDVILEIEIQGLWLSRETVF